MKRAAFYELVERATLADLISKADTPCYFYVADILRHQIDRVRACVGQRFEMHYALKANPHPEILRTLFANGVGADVASANELRMSLAAGAAPEMIEFSGPGKRAQELELAVDAGIGAINIENLAEVDEIADIAARLGKRARVGLRLNPGKTAGSTGMRMSGDTQFGLTMQDAAQALERIRTRASHLDFTGFHAHLASQELNADKIFANFETVITCARALAKSAGVAVRKINFGGGWGIDYFDKQGPLDLYLLGQKLADLDTSGFDDGLKLIIEPGRFLTGECGVFVTRVLYRKATESSEYLITDGGMNANYILAGGMGQVIKRNFEMDVFPARQRPEIAPHAINIAGPLCTPQDVLAAQYETNQDIQPGDAIVFFNSGAYGPTASPINFLGHDHSQEWFIDD